MLINLTVSNNHWDIFGLRPDFIMYAIIIGLASYLGFRSRYRNIVTAMFCFWMVMRLLYSVSGGEPESFELSRASLSIIFAVAGAIIYGRNPAFLHKQFMVYFALCIPIMLLQVLGVSQFVHGWNTDFAHTGAGLLVSEVGTFKEIPLFPALFVGLDNLGHSIGQSRPVGLMYSNNPLSIFVSIFIALNLAIERTSRIRFSDIVATAMIVLTMAKLVFGVTIIIYLLFFVFGMGQKRILVLKLIVLLAIGLSFYYFLFPGLFINHFSEGMVMVSIMLRLGDFWRAAGFEMFSDTINELSFIYTPNTNLDIVKTTITGQSYSSFAMLVKSDMMILWLSMMILGFLLYLYRIRKIKIHIWRVYIVTLFVCIITQAAVPFYSTNAFQLILGFALFPLFNKMWLNYSYSLRIIK